MQHFYLVLHRLLENKHFINAEKCEFHVSFVSFLGCIIEDGQVKTDQVKVQAVAEWPKPTYLKQLQHFLGFTNFYYHFLQNFCQVAVSLTQLTSTAFPLIWSLKQTPPSLNSKAQENILIQSDTCQQFSVKVDASDTGVGVFYSQRSVADQKLHPCAFFSRRLSPAESRCNIGDCELLAVKLAYEEWGHWLEGA